MMELSKNNSSVILYIVMFLLQAYRYSYRWYYINIYSKFRSIIVRHKASVESSLQCCCEFLPKVDHSIGIRIKGLELDLFIYISLDRSRLIYVCYECLNIFKYGN